MATYIFNAEVFKSEYPEFDNDVQYPDSLINRMYAVSLAYRYNSTDCYVNQIQLKQIIDLLVAHLLYLNVPATKSSGNTNLLTKSEKARNVDASYERPDVNNNFNYWLSTSTYGMQLLALLRVIGASGIFISGPQYSVNSIRETDGFFYN